MVGSAVVMMVCMFIKCQTTIQDAVTAVRGRRNRVTMTYDIQGGEQNAHTERGHDDSYFSFTSRRTILLCGLGGDVLEWTDISRLGLTTAGLLLDRPCL